MGARRGLEIDWIVETALEHTARERESFVAEACAGEAQLREAVEAELLRRVSHAAPKGSTDMTRTLPSGHPGGTSSEEPPRPVEPEPPEPEIPLTRGASLGRYIVVDWLGGGSMGVVYTAYDPELDRKVAIKLVRPETSSRREGSEGFARLQREARAIARVSHPNVIAVHDVGMFGDEVFVAMEYIDGVTLARWLAPREGRARRDYREVVAMFMQAGRGLAAAHAVGVVHRDFKPDNVLVGRDGRARVLDFGLARSGQTTAMNALRDALAAVNLAAGSSPPSDPSLTQTLTGSGVFVGTPAYMAPEHFTGVAADARMDQFSFCVALYEGVYGERPFVGDTLPALAASIARGKVREAPKSANVPAWLREALLRGLRPRPEERYASMDELLAELSRDRTRARRRVLTIGGGIGLAVAAVVGFFVAMTAESRVCRGAEEKLAGVWDPDRKRALEAAFDATGKPYAKDAARGVVQALDAYAEGWASMQTEACEATRVRGEQSEELFDLRTGCLSQRREDLKSLVDLFTRADARIVEKSLLAATGLTALSSCSSTAPLRGAVRPPADPAVRAKVEELRKDVGAAKALRTAGKYAEAIPVAERAMNEGKAIHYQPLVAEAYYELGAAAAQKGDAKLAEESLHESLYAAEASRHDEIAARAWVALVWLVGYELARYDESRDLQRHAAAAIERWGGNEELTAALLSHVGVILVQQGKHQEGRAEHERALALREKVLGTESHEVALSLNNLGIALMRLGQYDEAMGYLRRALLIDERTLGPSHPDVTRPLTNMSSVLADQGNYKESLPYDERALQILERALAPEHPQIGLALSNICSTKVRLESYDAALADCARALAIYEKSLGDGHPRLAFPLTEMGNAYLAENQPARAVAVLERAAALREASTVDPVDSAETHFALARALRGARGDKRRCRSLAEKARESYARSAGDHQAEIAEIDGWLRAPP